MVEIYIDENWNFKEAVAHIEVLKKRVSFIDASFSCFNIKQRIQFKRELRRQIYALKFEEWKRDKILECIYGDFEIEKLERMI